MKVAIVNVNGQLKTIKGEDDVLALVPTVKIVDTEKVAAAYIEGYAAGQADLMK